MLGKNNLGQRSSRVLYPPLSFSGPPSYNASHGQKKRHTAERDKPWSCCLRVLSSIGFKRHEIDAWSRERLDISGVAYGLQAATAWGTTPQQWEQRTELMRLERDAAVHFVSRRSSSFVQACTSPQLEFLLIQAYIFLIKPGCAKILNLLEGVVILPEHGDFPKYCNSKIFTRSLHERRIFDQQAARRILNSPLSWVCMKPCFWFLSRHIINYILQAPSRSNRSNAPFQV